MKLDIFNHIFPARFYERMLDVVPDGKDMHKRVRASPSIVDLDERFRIMDHFGDYAQIICLGSPPIEVFGPPAVSVEMAKLANDGMAELVAARSRGRAVGGLAKRIRLRSLQSGSSYTATASLSAAVNPGRATVLRAAPFAVP